MTAYFNYADMPVSEGRIYGLGWGLGGILNCALSDNFRIGCMGSTYRLDYGSHGVGEAMSTWATVVCAANTAFR